MTHIVRVELSKRGTWFFATSNDLRGMFVSNPSLGEVYAEIPDVIKLLFNIKHGLKVEVRETACPEKSPIDELVYAVEELPVAA